MFFYIHIPFCRQKCTYCKFALSPVFNELKIETYCNALKKEIQEFFQTHAHRSDSIESIYFGWGTPSILSDVQIKEILKIFPREQFSKNIEITFEANPEDVSEWKWEGLQSLWINRISLGVQTLSDQALTEIGRSSSWNVFSALSALKKTGFSNVNVDFILGLPHVLSWEILENIKKLHSKSQNITHTSVYFLEKGTYPKGWGNLCISEGEILREYWEIRKFLIEEKGFRHYEISNFWKPWFESQHNRAYWNHSNYRGFGLSAASYMGGKRFENAHSFAWYYRGDRVHEELLSEAQIRMEKWMFGLRTFCLMEDNIMNPDWLEECIQNGWIEEVPRPDLKKCFSLTSAWIFVVDHIMSRLL